MASGLNFSIHYVQIHFPFGKLYVKSPYHFLHLLIDSLLVHRSSKNSTDPDRQLQFSETLAWLTHLHQLPFRNQRKNGELYSLRNSFGLFARKELSNSNNPFSCSFFFFFFSVCYIRSVSFV